MSSIIEKIQTKLNEISREYDTRSYYSQITIVNVDQDHCRLAGSVLDESLLGGIIDKLSSTFSNMIFDVGSVQALRPGRQVTVSTSVTGLYADPSFSDEMLSQLLNGWPLELLIERDSWVFVRQPDGYLGWTYLPYLIDDLPLKPNHLVYKPISSLRTHPDYESPLSERIAGGTAVRVIRTEGEWTLLSLAGGKQGWVPAKHLRPLEQLPVGESERRSQIVALAKTFTGVPYFWGGITAYGLDCSGYVQLLHRLVGLTIPRDTDLQFASGQLVEPPFKSGDLLFFGSQGGHRAITHVGMSLGDWRIIHSSRARNGVHVDNVKTVSWLEDAYVGARTYVNLPVDLASGSDHHPTGSSQC
jgi:hypothetical protein